MHPKAVTHRVVQALSERLIFAMGYFREVEKAVSACNAYCKIWPDSDIYVEELTNNNGGAWERITLTMA